MSMKARLRAFEVLKRLPDGPVKGAEIGVYRGDMSLGLLQRKDLLLYMVDNWKGLEIDHFKPGDQADNLNYAINQTAFAYPRRFILPFDSAYAASLIPADDPELGQLDFVFIDADHSYEGVKRDIEIWLPKIKKGGLLGGHDYNNPRIPEGIEVKRAVDEKFPLSPPLEMGLNTCWFVRV